jgi:quinohemoprotein ethanol dehydrogenase
VNVNTRIVAAAFGSALLIALGAGVASAQKPLPPLPTPSTPPPVPAILQNYKPVTAAQLTKPGDGDWLQYRGTYDGWGYSPLSQINARNAHNLKLAWTLATGRVEGHEAPPIVTNGVMFVATPGNQVLAVDAKSGNLLWRYKRPIPDDMLLLHPTSRGVGLWGDKVYFAAADAVLVALDVKTGKEVWKTPLEEWQNGYSITSAPLYYDGIVYIGMSGGEFGVRGRLTALDAKTGKVLWRWFTIPKAEEFGSDTWPAKSDTAERGGGTIWNTPALDPELGLVYFATGNCGPDLDGSSREGDNLFCVSIVALKAKTGEYAWHFQEVHHDLWDYDGGSPVVLFDTTIDGKPRKGLAQAGKTGWVYLLDRTNGKPLIGIDERPVPQEPRQKTAKTQPYPIGDAVVPQCAKPEPGYDAAGCIFAPFWETPVLIQPGVGGGTVWAPMPYSPDTGLFYVGGTVRTTAFLRYGDIYKRGMRYMGGSLAATPIGSPMSGTFTAIAANTNKIAWQHQMPYRMGGGGGSTVTAGGILFRGEPDGSFVAVNAKTGEKLWSFQTGFGADAPAIVYQIDGDEYVAIATGGNSLQGSAFGDAVWVFSLKGQLSPLWPPPPPPVIAGPGGPLMAVNKIDIGANNVEYSYFPARTKIKAGTTVTFTNTGDTAHTATAYRTGDWDTGVLTKGQSKEITFNKAGTYYYICTPHPWMYGQVIVE